MLLYRSERAGVIPSGNIKKAGHTRIMFYFGFKAIFETMNRSLTRSTDPVLSKFDQDEISVVSHMLDFLYDKSILSADNHLRNMELHYVIGVGGVRDIPHQTWVFSKALERLNTIVSSTGDMHSDHVPPGVQSWETAMTHDLKDWAKQQLWFQKFDGSAPESRPLQRSQLSRLCYIHAPVVLISYVQRFHGQQGVKMINIMEWMRSSFGPEKLNRHIFGNSGGDSWDVLQTLVGGRSCTVLKDWSDIEESTFEKYGPALVFRFEVHENFKEERKFIYTDDDAPPTMQQSKGNQQFVIFGLH